MMRVVTLGEVMLRLKSPQFERFFQSPLLEATFGGGEANVAVSLARFGLDAAFVTVLPKNPLGDAAIAELRRHGVDTSRIMRGGERLGIYFLETGANQRPSVVIYDRSHSSMTEADPRTFDWDRIFDGGSCGSTASRPRTSCVHWFVTLMWASPTRKIASSPWVPPSKPRVGSRRSRMERESLPITKHCAGRCVKPSRI